MKGRHITDIAGKAWRMTALDLKKKKTSELAFLGERMRRVVHSSPISTQRIGILWLFFLSLGNLQLVVAMNCCLLG